LKIRALKKRPLLPKAALGFLDVIFKDAELRVESAESAEFLNRQCPFHE